jgi:DNA-binding transcriptional LysR family regulator
MNHQQGSLENLRQRSCRFHCRPGRVIALLRDFEPDPVSIHAVYPPTRHLASKVRVFVDFMAQRFAGEPEWHQGWT